VREAWQVIKKLEPFVKCYTVDPKSQKLPHLSEERALSVVDVMAVAFMSQGHVADLVRAFVLKETKQRFCEDRAFLWAIYNHS
jgi:hypothetical protein